MYRATTKSLQQLISKSNTVSRRVGKLSRTTASAFHTTTPSLYPRKSPPQDDGSLEDAWLGTAMQELMPKDGGGKDGIDLKGLSELDVAAMLQQDTIQGPPPIAQSEEELFGVSTGTQLQHPITPLPSGLDPRSLPVQITSVADLGPNFTEKDYASALIHGRSIHLPFLHPRTHSIPAATITFYSHHPPLLSLFTHFASHAASSLGIPISKVIPLPTKRRLWTVIRAPFAYKKSQENFERRTYMRMIKAWDADPEVVDRWVKYLERHSMGGVGIRVNKWSRAPVGVGKMRLERVLDGFKFGSGQGGTMSKKDAKMLEVKDEEDSGAGRKLVIKALGKEILETEKGRSGGGKNMASATQPQRKGKSAPAPPAAASKASATPASPKVTTATPASPGKKNASSPSFPAQKSKLVATQPSPVVGTKKLGSGSTARAATSTSSPNVSKTGPSKAKVVESKQQEQKGPSGAGKVGKV